jgi:hypothetical protein
MKANAPLNVGGILPDYKELKPRRLLFIVIGVRISEAA